MVWVQDSITADEALAVEYLRWAARGSPSLADRLSEMVWVQDGITANEARAVQFLSRAAHEGLPLADRLLEMVWVQDGITEIESDVIKHLDWIAYHDGEAVTSIIAMPFLKSVEADDVLAIREIRELTHPEDDSLLSALINHPTLRNGITDVQTTLVAAAGTHWDADEIRRVLSPGYADIEIVSRGTELAPGLKISIVRTRTQPKPRTAGIVTEAIGFAEETMQLPLPVSHVIVVLNDKTGNKGYGGANHGTPSALIRIASNPKMPTMRTILNQVSFTKSPTTTGASNHTGLTKAWLRFSSICTVSKPG